MQTNKEKLLQIDLDQDYHENHNFVNKNFTSSETVSVSDLCTDAGALLSSMTDPAYVPHVTDLDCTPDMDEIWGEIEKCTRTLARAPSVSFADIVGKIHIWRHVAPDEEGDESTIDEILLTSIMLDVERLIG